MIGTVAAAQVIVSGSGDPYYDAVIADTPLMYLRLGDTSGTTAADASGNSRSGTYVNSPGLGAASLLSSGLNKAVDFDGIDDRIDVVGASWMAPSSGFTVECLIKPDVVSGSHAVITRADYNSSQNPTTWAFYIHQSGSQLVYGIMPAFGGMFASPAVGPVLSVGTKYHVALTYDNQNIKFMMNGIVVDTRAFGSVNTIANPTTSNLVIAGEHGGNQAERFDGVIDEVAFYGSAISPARIAAHYAAA